MSSSCCRCKSRELGGRESPRFPCVTLMVASFFSDLLRAIISYWAVSHLESCKTSKMTLFSENSRRSYNVDYFCKKTPPLVFEWTPNLVIFTEEVLSGKLHFLCCVSCCLNLRNWRTLCIEVTKVLKLLRSPISGVKTDVPVKSLPKKVLSFKITRKAHARAPNDLPAQVCTAVYTQASYLLKE